MKQHAFKVKGMVCNSCEKIILKQFSHLNGIQRVKVDYSKEKVEVDYYPEKVTLAEIKKAIEEKGYQCIDDSDDSNSSTSSFNWLNWIFTALGLFLLVYFAWTFYGTVKLPEISQNMGYGLLFVVGLLTGFHCVGMCGGFVVSYVTKGAKEGKKPLQLHASYALGKVISYTVIGAAFGLLGSIIAFTPLMRGIAGILAGLFLLFFGLKMLNFFPVLRKFSLKMPSFMNKFVHEESKVHRNNPFIIGLLNGLMIACGPLQALYILAAGTGSMLEGAKMLFVFALGTLPVMLGFGYLTNIISQKATPKILKASGIIVIILGLVMINRGLALTGAGYDFNSLTSTFTSLVKTGSNPTGTNSAGTGLVLKDGYQEIRMEVNRYGWDPDKFILQKDVPVKWIIDGKELNGCNSGIQVPKLGLNFKIKPEIQTIEFTPTGTGTIAWSCWMGMIQGVFEVKDSVDINSINQDLDEIEVPKGGGCGMGSGCGCGGG